MKYQCANCGFTAEETEFPELTNPGRRFAVGDTYTDKECPKTDCGAAAYPVELVNPKPAARLIASGARLEAIIQGNRCDECNTPIPNHTKECQTGSALRFQQHLARSKRS